MTFKKGIRKIHLWLGLVSGLVVFIISITGCLYVFQKEISHLYYKNILEVDIPQKTNTLPVSVLIKNAEAKLGANKKANSLTSYKERNRAWEVMIFKAGSPNAITYFEAIDEYKVVFVNPYNGKITGEIDYKYNFFNIVKYLHWSLLLSTPYGQPIVGYSTLIFVIMMISGLILWWPKNLKPANANKSFKIKWTAKFKRLNYDFHNVLGFYSIIILFIISLTGLMWAFKWVQTGVYVVAARSISPPNIAQFTSDTSNIFRNKIVAIDLAFSDAQKRFSTADRISISQPKETDATINITGYRGKEIYFDSDDLKYDQHKGSLLNRRNFNDKNAGEKMVAMQYDIHIGTALGLPGKFIAFFASLVSASLPITGFVIWLGKRKKRLAAA